MIQISAHLIHSVMGYLKILLLPIKRKRSVLCLWQVQAPTCNSRLAAPGLPSLVVSETRQDVQLQLSSCDGSLQCTCRHFPRSSRVGAERYSSFQCLVLEPDLK